MEIGFGEVLAGAGALSSIFGGNSAADAAEEAARIQAEAAREGAGRIENQGRIGRNDLAPWRTAGGDAQNLLSLLLGTGTAGSGRAEPVLSKAQFEAQYNQPVGRGWLPTERANIDKAYAAYMDRVSKRAKPVKNKRYGSLLKDFTAADFVAEPGYQFRLSEGTRGIDRAAAARGSFDSGATLKALQRFTQDYASNEFGNAYARDASNKSRKFNMLSGVSGSGLQASGTTAALGADVARSVADLYGQAANANAAGVVGGNASRGNALQGAFSDMSDYVMMQNLLRR